MQTYARVAGLGSGDHPRPGAVPRLSVALGRTGDPRARLARQAPGRVPEARGRRDRARHRRLGPGPARRTAPAGAAILLALHGSSTHGSTAAGRQRPCAARPARRSPPTRTGPAAASTRTTGRRPVDASPESLWSVIEGIGGRPAGTPSRSPGRSGGSLDRAVGGVGPAPRPARPRHLFVGESLDFWRVEERVPGRLLRLRAEMKLPGPRLARPRGGPMTRRRDDVRATRPLPPARPARATPTGGRSRPFHGIVFGSMARNIARAAEALERPDRGGEVPRSGLRLDDVEAVARDAAGQSRAGR